METDGRYVTSGACGTSVGASNSATSPAGHRSWHAVAKVYSINARRDRHCSVCGSVDHDKRKCPTTSFAIARGLCRKHGAWGFCSVQGCGTAATARGLCQKHCSNGLCSVQGCVTVAVARGLCAKHGPLHGAWNFCSVQGCSAAARRRKLCIKHQNHVAKEKRSVPHVQQQQQLCRQPPTTIASCAYAECCSPAQILGICAVHRARWVCYAPGCAAIAVKLNGLCHVHFRNIGDICCVHGCLYRSFKDGFCKSHSSKKICTTPGCRDAVSATGLCTDHAQRASSKVCFAPDCTSAIYAQGFCKVHRSILRYSFPNGC